MSRQAIKRQAGGWAAGSWAGRKVGRKAGWQVGQAGRQMAWLAVRQAGRQFDRY